MNTLMLTTGGAVDEQPCVDSNMAFSSYKWVHVHMFLTWYTTFLEGNGRFLLSAKGQILSNVAIDVIWTCASTEKFQKIYYN